MPMSEKERAWFRDAVALCDCMEDADPTLEWIRTTGENVLRVVLYDDHVYMETFANITNLSIVDGDYPYHMVPDWVKDRVAALYITAPPPPPHPVDGVGIRINENTFWVEAPEGENQWRQQQSTE